MVHMLQLDSSSRASRLLSLNEMEGWVVSSARLRAMADILNEYRSRQHLQRPYLERHLRLWSAGLLKHQCGHELLRPLQCSTGLSWSTWSRQFANLGLRHRGSHSCCSEHHGTWAGYIGIWCAGREVSIDQYHLGHPQSDSRGLATASWGLHHEVQPSELRLPSIYLSARAWKHLGSDYAIRDALLR